MTYHFYNTCVNWPRSDVAALTDMCDYGLEISRRTFLKHVDREELADIEEQLGYAAHYKQGMTMASDYAVQYFRGVLHGHRTYWFVWSGIEYVFTKGEN